MEAVERLYRLVYIKLYVRKDIAVKSDISTYLMREEGQTQLLIKRNGKLIQTYYISK